MVHELIGISRNRVSLKDAPGISKDLEQARHTKPHRIMSCHGYKKLSY
jgi:hypothetical protein